MDSPIFKQPIVIHLNGECSVFKFIKLEVILMLFNRIKVEKMSK